MAILCRKSRNRRLFRIPTLGSPLSNDGSVPHAAIDLAADLALHWSPADIYCLDLAASGDRLGVIEANCFNASRFYSAVIEHGLRAVNTYVLSRQ
jgi:hypothetical protein